MSVTLNKTVLWVTLHWALANNHLPFWNPACRVWLSLQTATCTECLHRTTLPATSQDTCTPSQASADQPGTELGQCWNAEERWCCSWFRKTYQRYALSYALIFSCNLTTQPEQRGGGVFLQGSDINLDYLWIRGPQVLKLLITHLIFSRRAICSSSDFSSLSRGRGKRNRTTRWTTWEAPTADTFYACFLPWTINRWQWALGKANTINLKDQNFLFFSSLHSSFLSFPASSRQSLPPSLPSFLPRG